MKAWPVAAIVLLSSNVSAQSPPAPSVTIQTTPVVSSATVPLKSDWNWKFDFKAPAPDETQWKIDLRTSLAAGRKTTLTFGVIGHRGYHLPTYMSESVASGGAATTEGASYVDAFARRSWDAHFRVERALFTTRRGTTFRAVSDVLIPLGRNDVAAQFTSMSALRSKALRVGLVIGF